MSKIVTMVVACALAGIATACTAGSAEEDEAASAQVALKGEKGDSDLAEVRRATAKYHDIDVAIADGYIPDVACEPEMGIHYFNPELFGAPPDPLRPLGLLYEPTKNGRLRLVGVEYFMPVFVNDEPWFYPETVPPPEPHSPAPVLFGKTFDGPMAGHSPDMPWHYDLHVWIWKHNPKGMFTAFNPTVRCTP
jgi:hypothetical protein